MTTTRSHDAWAATSSGRYMVSENASPGSRITAILLSAIGLWLLLVGSRVSAAAAETDLLALLAQHPLQTLDGEEVRLDDLRGRVVVINFWAQWCKPCLRELPVFDQWYRELNDRGVRFVAISIARRPSAARRVQRDLKLSLPLYHDGPDGLARQIDLPSLPVTYLIDRGGRVAEVSMDGNETTLHALRIAIDEVLPARRAASVEGSVEGGFTQ